MSYERFAREMCLAPQCLPETGNANIENSSTTDTISAAGPWLKYKGHLPNISANTLIGAVNAATGETNVAYDHFEPGSPKSGIPELAEKWKQLGKEWLVVAEDNYGEGSAVRVFRILFFLFKILL